MGAELGISFDAPAAAREMLTRIGRTEDASFSPDNRRLALVCLERHSIAIADVVIEAPPGPPHVTVTRVAELAHPTCKTPHGVDFLDDERILVANRYGKLRAFRLPPNATNGAAAELTPIELPADRDFDLLGGPGSVRVLRERPDALEVFVCNNLQSTVSRHEIRADPLEVTRNELLLRRLLEYPDGVAVSSDRRWLAISNHHAHVVMLYRWSPALSEASDPDCILRGTIYPHGLRFSPDGRFLIVADAGRPHVNLYANRDGDWHGVRYPDASVRVMSDDVFALATDADSRGPKGVGIDVTGRILALTFEKQPIEFFDLSAMLEYGAQGRPSDCVRLDYELEALELERARREQLTTTLLGSRSYRITKPLRMLNAARKRPR